MSALATDMAVGAVSGFAAGRVMDRATTWFMERQSPRSRARENRLTGGGAPTSMARKAAGLAGARLDDEDAARLGALLHQSLGFGYGAAGAALVRAGMRPVPAGLATAAGSFVLVDEGMNAALGITPPPWKYPPETHLRGVVGHAVFGLAAGAAFALARRLGALRP